MMKRLFQSLRRLLIVALVGVFISVGTFTQKAAAEAFTQSAQGEKPAAVNGACSITKGIGKNFENPPFAYADKRPITLDADQGIIHLDQDYNGYLYKSTYYDANDKQVIDDKPKYTPPTIVVSPNHSIDLKLTNNLPPKVQLTGQIPKTEENIQNQSQDTNLHYHGFNVSPLLGSDDVVMHVHSKKTPYSELSSKQGSSAALSLKQDPFDDNGDIYPGDSTESPKYGSIAEYQMRVNLPKGHQSGLFWYHPHAHTVSDNQVRAGMSGGIIVNGIEEFYTLLDPDKGIKVAGGSIAPPTKQPTQLAITQQVMLFKDFNNVLAPKAAPVNCFTLNGQVEPTITIHSGEVQLWRIGNIGADTYLNLVLRPNLRAASTMPFYILARDGDAVNKPIKTQKVLLPPASRVELLVVGGEFAQKYYLVSTRSSEATTYEGTLATVKVGGLKSGVIYRCPENSQPLSCIPYTPIINMDKYITSQKPAQIDPLLPNPEDLAGYPPCEPGQVHTQCITPWNAYLDDPLTQKRTFTFNSNSPTFTRFTINDKLYDENRIDKVSHLGDIEEWQVVNDDSNPHAFHMHQLDFLVTKVILKDKPTGDTYDNYKIADGGCTKNNSTYTCPLEPQGYRDTINLPPNSTTTIRIPFLNPFITGVFVYHCHILGHEDSGMMQNLKVIDPNHYQPESRCRPAKRYVRDNVTLYKDRDCKEEYAKITSAKGDSVSYTITDKKSVLTENRDQVNKYYVLTGDPALQLSKGETERR